MHKAVSVYAIRHKPTGFYLPGSSRSALPPSMVEPVDPREQPPRVWAEERHAHSTLTIWLRGIHKADYDDETGSVHTEIVAPPVPRRREDMEVVQVELLLP